MTPWNNVTGNDRFTLSPRRRSIRPRPGRRGEPCPCRGIVLRPNDNTRADDPPFPTWAYTPSYLPAGLAIDVGVDTPLNEPEFFYLGFQRGRIRPAHEPIAHPIGATVITA